MKCEVVRDLIPLYDEKLCSAETAALLEEHIKTCTDCKALLKMLSKTEIPGAYTNELKPFEKVNRTLRARAIALITLGILLLAGLIPVGCVCVRCKSKR
ncbi:MAG: zf-HC2 domain-containing protein [Oscillospiraceae bacterium]|nr:zf-HC2 domain-containing protein [Oscillospiraceae bacterium]